MPIVIPNFKIFKTLLAAVVTQHLIQVAVGSNPANVFILMFT